MRTHEIDLQQAAFWYEKSAKQGHPPALLAIARMYMKGLGVARNEQFGVEYYKKLEEIKDPQWECYKVEAQYKLGNCYRKGIGVSKDEKKAYEYYYKVWSNKVAAEKNIAWKVQAAYQLGQLYEKGVGVKKSNIIALSFYHSPFIFTQERTDVHVKSMLRIGDIYAKGQLGRGKNKDLAIKFYLAAAKCSREGEEGDPYCRLGNLYLESDEGLALEWYQKSALLSYPEGLYRLGLMHKEGRGGLEVNVIMAIFFFKLAGSLNNANALEMLDRYKEAIEYGDYPQYREVIKEAIQVLNTRNTQLDIPTLPLDSKETSDNFKLAKSQSISWSESKSIGYKSSMRIGNW